jgi:hypothetical protein
MPCDHLGPEEFFAMAEAALREQGIGAERWSGAKFRHGENLDGGMWASVVMEAERRGDQWIVTRLDRRKERLPDSETGLAMLTSPES